MTERAARVVAPAALALFAVLGALMTDRAMPGAAVAAAVAIGIGVVLAWRRTTGWPMIAGLAMASGALVFLGHAQSSNLCWMGLCVVAAWVALTSAAPLAVASGAVLALVPIAEWALDTAEPGWGAWFAGISFTTVLTIFARRLRLAMGQLRAAQDELAERSRAEERTRIATEVHDVIGHALTVSLLHISAARLALDEDPHEARRSLREAERLTRDSLEEVRATVGLMRTDVPGDRAPLPGAGDLPALVESFRRAGSDVQLVADGHLEALGATRGLAAYRIVQEALTNATRHAPGRPVVVQVGPAGDGTTVTVHNDGPSMPVPTPGAGLLGMRERAESLGGHLTAGPVDGGWRVEAVLPRE
jgi:signal transduction histidine kinase